MRKKTLIRLEQQLWNDSLLKEKLPKGFTDTDHKMAQILDFLKCLWPASRPNIFYSEIH